MRFLAKSNIKRFYTIMITMLLALGTVGMSVMAPIYAADKTTAASNESRVATNYTVEFTYNEKQYVMQGDTTIALFDVLDYIGLSRNVSAVSVSAPELFSASNETGEWLVTAHQAFSSTEWMKVVIDGVEYEIVVTDDMPSYINNWNGKNYIVASKLTAGQVINFSQLYADYGVAGVAWDYGAYHYMWILKDGNYVYELSRPYFYSTDYTGEAIFDGKTYVVTEVDTYYKLYIKTKTQEPASISYENTTASKTFGDSSFINPLTNTGDGVVTYSSDNTSVATVNSTTGQVAVVGVGSATITATVADSDNYTYATKTASYTLTVSKKNISPSVTMNGWTYGDVAQDPSVSGNPEGGAVTYEYKVKGAEDTTYSSTKPSTPGDYTVRASIAATTNYNAGTATADFTIAKKEVTVTAASDSKTYDGSPLTKNSYTNTELLSGDVLSNVTVTGSQTDAGTGNNVPSGGVIKKGDTDVTAYYDIKYVNGTLTVNKRDITFTSATDSKVYDGTPLTNHDVSVSAGSFVNGEGVTFNVTGTRTIPGTGKNTFTYAAKDGTNINNYNVTKVEGDLTITDRSDSGDDKKYEINLRPNGGTFKYDGAEKSVSGFEQTDFTFNGVKYTVSGITAEKKATDAGTYRVTTSGTPIVKNQAGDVLTNEFIVTTADSDLVINKRNVTMTSASDSKVYDGEALTNGTVNVTGDGFATGEGADYSVTGTQTLAGSSANHFTYTLKSGTKEGNYNITKSEGTLTVNHRGTKYEIAPQAKSSTIKYDGSEKSVTGFVTNSFTVEGHTYTLSGLKAEGKGTDAGTYTVKVSGEVIVTDSSGNNVTQEFAVNSKTGTLTIEKRNVTLTSGTKTKEYDGKPLTDDTVTPSGDGFVTGEGAHYNVTGTRTTPGTAANSFTYTLNDNTKAANYVIETHPGTLTVNHRNTKYEITVKAKSSTVKYDGSQKTVSGWTIDDKDDGSFVINGSTYTLIGKTATVSGTDAGTYTSNVVGTPEIDDANGNDVTQEFKINVESGKLIIEPRNVTLTSASDSKPYDGTALTNDKVTVSGDGFADGEGATYDVHGTQTAMGSSDNTFDYHLNDGTTAGNYKITKVLGKLEVTKAANKVTASINGWTYGDKPNEPSAAATFGQDTATFTYSDAADGTYTDTVPTNAGTYYVKAMIAETPNYSGAVSEPAEFVIGRKEISRDMLSVDPVTFKADGAEHGPAISMKDEAVAIPEMVKDTDYELSGDLKATEDGTYFVTVTGKGNYTGTLDTSWKIYGEQSGYQKEEGKDGAGDIEVFVDIADKTEGFKVNNVDLEFAKSLMTEEEKARYADGEDILVYVDVAQQDRDAVDATDKTILDRLFNESGAKGVRWFDITVWKQVGTEAAQRVHNTGKDISFTIEVPDEYKKAADGYTRAFTFAEAHDGKAIVLAKTEKTSIGFASDKFSTFALAYKDTKDPVKDSDADADGDDDRSGSARSKGAKTSDENNLMEYIALFATTLLAAAGVMSERRKRMKR